MEEIATQNLAILTERWPTLARKTRLTPPPAHLDWVTVGHDPTLGVSGLRLWSAYDPFAEAEIQASMIPQESPTAWIYGVGSGDLIRALLRREAIRRLHVVPLNIGLFHFLLHTLDNRDWLADPRVQLLDPTQQHDVEQPFAAIPPCLSVADARTHALCERIGNALLQLYEKERHEKRKPMRERQIEQNLSLLRTDGDVTTLFGSAPETTAFVAIAGPTLRETGPWIAKHRSEGLLIAVDGALTPLLNMGITPDFVVSLDDNRDSVIRYFEGDLTRCATGTLVYTPIVHHDVLMLWPGRRLAMYTFEPIYAGLKKHYPRGELFASGSVSHSAVDLAVKMGADKVVLFGADFGFPNGDIHANTNAPLDLYSNALKAGAKAIDGFGNQIPTSAVFSGYRIGLERYVREHAQVRFINVSRAGAKIAGTEYMSDIEP